MKKFDEWTFDAITNAKFGKEHKRFIKTYIRNLKKSLEKQFLGKEVTIGKTEPDSWLDNNLLDYGIISRVHIDYDAEQCMHNRDMGDLIISFNVRCNNRTIVGIMMEDLTLGDKPKRKPKKKFDIRPPLTATFTFS